MKAAKRGQALIVSLMLASCASVYEYRYVDGSPDGVDAEAIRTRLLAVLEPIGFGQLNISDPADAPQGGDTGYGSCPGADELAVFLRRTSGRTVVHVYRCDGAFRIVAIADHWVRHEPGRTSAALSEELADELASGRVTLRHRYRLALE